MPRRPLIVGTDGSDQALRAVDWATDEAFARGLPLRIVYASKWSRYDGLAPSLTRNRPAGGTVEAEHVVASAAERSRARVPQVEVATEVSPESAVHALVEESHGAAAVVVGSRGLGSVAGTLLGSVSLAVAARARCPVVVVRGELLGDPRSPGRIVVGLGKPGASPAVPQFAFEEAKVHGGSVDVVHAWMLPHAAGRAPGREAAPEWEERQKQALAGLSDAVAPAAADHPDVAHEELPVEGPPKQILIEAAQGAHLLVVGAPARTEAAGLPLGTVTHAALHYAPCPVAVVPSV